MTEFSAGRFVAVCHLGPANGEATTLIQMHLNGSREEIARMNLRKEDLLDLEYVLRRVIGTHGAKQ